MHKIIEVEALPEYRLRLKYADGVEGIADVSHLTGKGVFSAWEDENFFKSVRINPNTHTVEWEGGIDLCPDNLYAKITGKEPLEVLKILNPQTERV